MHKISKDILRSLKQLENILNIIEEKINLPKKDILLEICINLDITIDAASRIFKKYCIVEDGLVAYIVKRKRSKALKEIKDIDDTNLIDEILKDTTQCSKYYLDRVFKDEYGIGVLDIVNRDNFEDYILEPIDINDIRENINSVYESIAHINKCKLMNISINRTELKINNINFEACAREIASQIV